MTSIAAHSPVGPSDSALLTEERLRRKQHLAVALRLFAEFGYDNGVAGHITVRDPGDVDTFWVNPFGAPFGRISVSQLIRVAPDGEVIEGDRPVNTAAFVIHSRVHAARPDVVAAAHAHTTHGQAWSALGRQLDPITQDACAFFDDHAVFDEYTGVVLDLEEGRRIASTLGANKAIILRNHGLLTVGESVDEAAWWLISMDRACHVQLLACAAGEPVVIPSEQAAITRAQVGSNVAGWFSFQPLYERIIAEQPDVLD